MAKIIISLCMAAAFLASKLNAQAKKLPAIPPHCKGEIHLGDHCAITSTSGMLSGSIDIKIFAVAEKSDFNGPDELIEIFTDFDSWPDYVANSGSSDIVFNQSAKLSTLTDQDGFLIYRNYSDYKIKTPVGYQSVRSVTLSGMVAPYENALRSMEFAVQTKGDQPVPFGAKPLNGAEGIKLQSGSIHVADCVNFDTCPDHQYLLIYDATIKPSVNLLPKVAASSILKATQALLIGMFIPIYYDAEESPI